MDIELMGHRSYQSRIGLTVDDIYVVSGQLHASQLRNGDRTLHRLDQQSRVLSDILNSQSELHQLMSTATMQEGRNNSSSSGLSELGGSQSSTSLVGIRAHTAQHQRSPCSPVCKCKCHNVHNYKSPQMLHEAFGTLFVGYSGYPAASFHRCTEPNCLSSSTFRSYVHYLFPSWFLAKALTLTLMTIYCGEVRVSLATRSLVSGGAEIFRFVMMDDVSGIKDLFSKRLASPDDSDSFNGDAALGVSDHTKYPSTCLSVLKAILRSCQEYVKLHGVP